MHNRNLNSHILKEDYLTGKNTLEFSIYHGMSAVFYYNPSAPEIPYVRQRLDKYPCPLNCLFHQRYPLHGPEGPLFKPATPAGIRLA